MLVELIQNECILTVENYEIRIAEGDELFVYGLISSGPAYICEKVK